MLMLAPLMALSAGVAIALVGYAIAALIMLIVAIVLTVVLVRRRPARKAAGEGVGPLVILPIVLYLLSVPYLLVIAALLVGSA